MRTLICTLIGLLALAVPHASAAIVTPTGSTVGDVDFEKHIMGLLGRTGCNMGSCHGSFQGKGGFRLSLFGFEPHKDIIAITRDGMGRRLNLANPDESLLLLKATGQVEHAGGTRFSKGSWQYQMFRQWIQAGAPWSNGSGNVKQIVITPPEFVAKKAGDAVNLKITAHYTDGSQADITSLCDFRTNDDAVADVSNVGKVRTIKPGSTFVVVNYRSNVLPVNVLVPMEAPVGFQYPKVPESNFVDTLVFTKLRQLNMVPSDLSSDEEFLRRVTIDTIGQLPTPEDYRAFAADRNPNKRAKKIDELLVHPMHAALWATKFCDITGNDTQALEQPQNLKAKRSQQWHDWFRKRVAENMPYDKIAHGVLVATTREGRSPEVWIDQQLKLDEQLASSYDTDYANRDTLDLYWKRQQQIPPELWGEKTAAAFMGVRIECAQCHKHPFDRWSQVEYREYANVFGQMAVGLPADSKKLADKINKDRRDAAGKKNAQINQIREVFLNANAKRMNHPDTGTVLPAKALGGPEIPFEKGKDMRETLFQWLVQPDNPFFARSFVNRIWGHYLGVGIVHPVDDFSLGNPPSNDRLLNAIAKDFVDHKFDIRHIERVVLNSRTYQLSSKPNETNKFDKVNYARSYVRPMMAEAVVDVLNTALGTKEKFGNEVKTGAYAVEVGASQLQNPALSYAFRIFGRPPRTSACDCERAMDPALPQRLFLMTDSTLLAKFNEPQGRLQQLIKSKKTDEEALEDLFLATLGRLPNAQDKKTFADYRQIADRKTAFTDTMWALINTREFILNH